MNQHARADLAPIPFIDVAAQRRRLGRAIDDAVARVLDHCQFILGPEVRAVEADLAAFCGARHAITCASGTDALLLPLMAKGHRPRRRGHLPVLHVLRHRRGRGARRRDAGLRRRRGGQLQSRSEERGAGDRDRAQARPQPEGADPGRSVRTARRPRGARRDRARRKPVRARRCRAGVRRDLPQPPHRHARRCDGNQLLSGEAARRLRRRRRGVHRRR